ncbi:Eco57I restriction-modification methylase domain-containing protein [Tranquillimonas alkanivorans]|uniref:site-specific DNA-methyltransferase (adenine-specific) n=1 Tax=Tranquillimonas alkanivorans TaxID=441119 RepID=A0A1I5VH71_9RHOB|nr:N-6 DNA methylase [Tranquillimonas alkanivorans]SFQ06898.1 Methyltransferase domain-containing protein [Tranquillimonas alkanivorans]
MARKTTDAASFPSLTVEGSLLSSAILDAVYAREADEQTPDHYRVRRGLSLRDEFSLSFRVAQAHYDRFARLTDPGPKATRDFVRDLLTEAFGFDDLADADAPLAMVAGKHRVPIVVVPPSDELDRASPSLSNERRRSAAFALQDYLNDHDEALWGLAANGTCLRLMRDNASLTRPAYIEADLAQIFDTDDLASFATFWLLIHRTRFGQAGTAATDCALERWRDAGAREGEAARDKLATQVEEALRILGTGFLAENADLRARIDSGDLKLTAFFNELLKLVYRLIFLMVAEDRNLLHAPISRDDPQARAKEAARDLYARGYALSSLRQLALRRNARDRHHDRFEGMKIVFSALAKGEARLDLPALGGLFAEGQMPDLRAARLPNRAFLQAIFQLGWMRQDGALVPVNWRAMQTEELGSVYESLLELQPQVETDGRTLIFATDAAETKGNQRKTTGSYYTPTSLVEALLDTALAPVLERTEAETREKGDDPAEALLRLTVIDPACGSGHFLLAAANRIATRVAALRAEGTPSSTDFRHALRDVARRCIHGVDRNPMAVELTKVALWIETVDPGLPLGFFDAQIRCGDALLGVFDLKALEGGIPDAAYKPLTGDEKQVAKFYEKANKDAKRGQGTFDFTGGRSDLPTAPLSAEFTDLRDLPEETVEDIAAKAQAYRDLRKQEDFQRARMGCNLYTAAFLLPKTGEVPASTDDRTVPTSEDVWLAVGQGKGRKPIMQNAKAATRASALHWPLEFPDIMGRGGFDVVLGNPPWERIKLQEKEFFAARDPEIATAANKAARDRLIKALRIAPEDTSKRALFEEFETAKRLSEATSTFVRVPGDHGGRFPFTGTGDVNTYALFAELFSRLVSDTGRAGVIVPTGIATDATTAPFFGHLVDERRIAGLVDFENSAPTFPAVHRSFKFCLLTLGRDEPEARFAFFLTEPAQLAEPERNFTLSPEQIAAINPNTKTAPVFRSRWDAELTAKIYRNAPVLIDESKGAVGNPWGVSFARLFDMSNDSGLFRTAAELEAEGFVRNGTDWVAEGVRPAQGALAVEGSAAHVLDLTGGGPRGPKRYVPLYEAKMIHQFDHRWAGYDAEGSSSADATPEEKANPDWEPRPRYWVPAEDVRVAGEKEAIAGVESRLKSRGWHRGWLMGWRDIARATDERSVIATAFPRVGVGHVLPLMFIDAMPQQWAALTGNLCALTLDFIARQKVGGTHLTYGYIKQFPVLLPDFYSEPRLSHVVPRVLELTYTSHTLASFARDLSYNGPPFPWDEARRAHLRAELDAFYARAYGLSRDELRYILDPADVKGSDYPSETFRVLKDKEVRLHGEYRTRRLVLEAWDRMESDGTFRDMGL